MNWNSWGEFAAMGGYGLYVWGALLFSALCILAEQGGLRGRWRAARRQLARAVRAKGRP